jgi:hypothetical protein
MKKKNIFWGMSFLITMLCLTTPELCTESLAGDMEILESNIAIGATKRHEWFPCVEYNPVENDFMAVWHTGGKMEETDTTSSDSIDGQIVSAEGELTGDPFVLSSPEPGWKTLPKLAHNMYTNEYGLTFTVGASFIGQDGYTAILNSAGEYVHGPDLLYESPYNISHPTIIFNPVRKEYLATYNDKNVVSTTDTLDNLGFILDEDGDITNGPFLIGSSQGTQFNPQLAHNPTDDTYMVNWEDFRNVESMWDSSDIYGALLDNEGEMKVEIPMIDDFGDEDEGDQRVQQLAYNPDRNEYLAAWRDAERPSLNGAALVGRIFKSDGTPAGEDFVIIDNAEDQGYPQLIYVQEKKQYFIAWYDTQNGDSDIYAAWLDESGKLSGEAIPICTDSGNQGYPYIAYSPLMESFLITWRDENAPDDFEILPDEGGGHIPGTTGNIMGALYGKPSHLCCQVKDKATGKSVQDALALIIGPSFPALQLTNTGGWFNVEENSQPVGTYLVLVFKLGYHIAIHTVDYAGVPLQETIELTSWW